MRSDFSFAVIPEFDKRDLWICESVERKRQRIAFGEVLVDLVGFEPTTSSMPFKKYQSLTAILARNNGLSRRRLGRYWTPRGGLQGLESTRTPGLHSKIWLPTCSRAVAGGSVCLLAEKKTLGSKRRCPCEALARLEVRAWCDGRVPPPILRGAGGVYSLFCVSSETGIETSVRRPR